MQVTGVWFKIFRWNCESKVVLVLDTGETAHDLAFSKGDVVTVLEPCNVMFWYLGENSTGRRGVVPINFFEVCASSYLQLSKCTYYGMYIYSIVVKELLFLSLVMRNRGIYSILPFATVY